MVVPWRFRRQRGRSRPRWWIVSEVAWYVAARMRETAYRPPAAVADASRVLLACSLDLILVIRLIWGTYRSNSVKFKSNFRAAINCIRRQELSINERKHRQLQLILQVVRADKNFYPTIILISNDRYLFFCPFHRVYLSRFNWFSFSILQLFKIVVS